MKSGDARTLLLIAVLGLGISACNGKSEPQPRDVQQGAALFVSRNCVTCHGPEGEGQPTGPKLRDLNEYYTVETLVTYLSDPDAAMARDERLRKRAEGFGALMPKYNYLPKDELEKLAVYVLSL